MLARVRACCHSCALVPAGRSEQACSCHTDSMGWRNICMSAGAKPKHSSMEIKRVSAMRMMVRRRSSK